MPGGVERFSPRSWPWIRSQLLGPPASIAGGSSPCARAPDRAFLWSEHLVWLPTERRHVTGPRRSVARRRSPPRTVGRSRPGRPPGRPRGRGVRLHERPLGPRPARHRATRAGTPTGSSRTSRAGSSPFSRARTRTRTAAPTRSLPDGGAELHGQLHALLRRCGSGRGPRPTSCPRSSPSGRSRACTGIGGAIQNFELQKTGSDDAAALPVARRTSGRRSTSAAPDVEKDVGPDAARRRTVDSRRLVFTVGNFTVLDVFDRNNVTWDPRQTFLNMAFMTHASWDFPSDARGYSWGGTAELYWDDWACRVGRITPPQQPEPAAPRLPDLEVLRRPARAGARPHASSGRPAPCASSATATTCSRAASPTPSRRSRPIPHEERRELHAAPALQLRLGERRTRPTCAGCGSPNVKLGIGIDLEQYVTEDIGRLPAGDVLRRADRGGRIQLGRPLSRLRRRGQGQRSGTGRSTSPGVGFGIELDLDIHAQYLAMGGVDGFIGDGHLRQAAPRASSRSSTASTCSRRSGSRRDYQFLWQPGLQRRPRPGQHPRREGPCRVLTRARCPRAAACSSPRAPLASQRARRSSKRRASRSSASIRRPRAAAGSSWTTWTCTAASAARWRSRPGTRATRCGSRTGSQHLARRLGQAFADFGFAATYDRWRLYLNLDVPLTRPGTERRRRRLPVHRARPSTSRRTPTR